MVRQLMPLRKFLIALFTFEWFLATVNPQMNLQRRFLMETPSTFATLVLFRPFLNGMPFHVRSICRLLYKSLLTNITNKLSIVIMDSHVQIQVTRHFEPLSAYWAQKWTDARVSPLMVLQMMDLDKTSRAIFAMELFAAIVRPCMIFIFGGIYKGFVTNFAFFLSN